MSAQIITTDDLREFKIELLDEIRSIVTEQKTATSKKWLKAVFVIPPLCSQKHSPKGKTSSLKKISRPRYASASIFSSALVATASTLIPALR